MINTELLINRYTAYDTENYKTYALYQEALINSIKGIDKGFYRIKQTTTRGRDIFNLIDES